MCRCVYVCTCSYVYIHVYIHVYMHVYIHQYIHVCTHICTHVYMYTYVHVYICAVYMCVHVYSAYVCSVHVCAVYMCVQCTDNSLGAGYLQFNPLSTKLKRLVGNVRFIRISMISEQLGILGALKRSII